MNDLITVAEKYLANGFNVIPLRLDGSKQPITPWKPYQERTASKEELNKWFGDGPVGIGVVTGSASGNLHVIDFDHEAIEHFERFWLDAEERLPGITDKLIAVATPRPGRQVWFRQKSEPPKSRTLALTEPQDAGTKDADGQPVLQPQVLIETRGTGGYVCAAGTPPETHRTGKSYEVLHGSFDSLPQLTDTEAAMLLDLCCSYTRHTPKRLKHDTQSYTGEPRPGDIFNQRADFRELLLDHGWDSHHVAEDGTDYMTRPGKQVADGSSATLGHIRHEDGRPLLYVFSTSAAPFEQGHCYDAFAAYALLEHDGDFSAAAASARSQFEPQLAAAQEAYHAVATERLPDPETYTPFPVELFPDVVQDYVTEHAEAIDIDAAYIAVPLLSGLAGLIGPAREIQIKRGWTEPSILWTVTVAKPSSGKSPGWEAAMAPLVAVNYSLHLANRNQQEIYKQQVADYKKAKGRGDKDHRPAEPNKPDPPKQLMIDDITMESLARVHQHNDRLIVSSEELAAWVNGMDQYRSGKGRDRQQWLRMYCGGAMNVNRATDDLYLSVPRTSVSVTGTIQPGVAAETLFSEKACKSGLAYRILAVQPPHRVLGWSNHVAAESVVEKMFVLAAQLYELEQKSFGNGVRPRALPCTEEAQKLFIAFVNSTQEIAEDASDDGEARWVKLRAVAARLALIVSVTRQLIDYPTGQAKQPIDKRSMQAGIDLATWFGNEMERNWLYVSGRDGQLMKHLQWIRNRHPKGAQARDLVSGIRSIKDANEARIVMQSLVDAGLGRMKENLFIPQPITI